MRAYVLVAFATVWSPGYCQAQSLFEALRQGDMTKVKAAINNGVDVNSRDAGGNTLLMQAAIYATAADLEPEPDDAVEGGDRPLGHVGRPERPAALGADAGECGEFQGLAGLGTGTPSGHGDTP